MAKNMAVFIDADNLNDPTALDHVLSDLRSRADRVLYKRAYGRTESLKGIEAVLWRHGVRPVANMIVNKVTTDSALVIDAVEAICTNDIDALVICSGDADFVPLATWARERGCHVSCFSLSDRIFANPEGFYDDVVLLEIVEKSDPVVASSEPELAKNQPQPQPQLLPNHPLAISVPESFAAPLIPLSRQTVHQTDEELVQQVLIAFPALRSGKPQHLSQVVAVLRKKGILTNNIKTTVWFAQWTSVFQLFPVQVPNQIIYKNPSQDDRQLSKTQTASPQPAPNSTPLPFKIGQPPHALPDEVKRILQALPALYEAPQMLSQVVPVLRAKNILGKTTKSTTFFASYGAYFKLSPAHQPKQLMYVAPSRMAYSAAGKVQKSTQTACSAAAMPAPTRAPAVISWPTRMGRRAAPPLLAELHGLRSVLIQRAVRGVTVADVLLAVPELLRGQPCALSAVAGRLREKGLLHSSQSALRILERYPGAFGVEISCMPQAVIYLR